MSVLLLFDLTRGDVEAFLLSNVELRITCVVSLRRPVRSAKAKRRVIKGISRCARHCTCTGATDVADDGVDYVRRVGARGWYAHVSALRTLVDWDLNEHRAAPTAGNIGRVMSFGVLNETRKR